MSSFWNLLRVLFPNWNFFDKVAYEFEIHYLPKGNPQWQVLFFQSDFKWWHFFVNPEHNLKLAQINILEHFAKDLQELPEKTPPNSLVSYQLLNQMISVHLDVGQIQKLKLMAKNPNQSLELFLWSPLERF